jgi:cold shock CspA family protein
MAASGGCFHRNGTMFVGTVKKVLVARGFAFIALPGSPDVFMHCYDLSDDVDWDETLQERRVEFEIEHSAKGPRAVLVRAAK